MKAYKLFRKRPKHQGGEWLISKWLKVVKELTEEEVMAIRGAAA